MFHRLGHPSSVIQGSYIVCSCKSFLMWCLDPFSSVDQSWEIHSERLVRIVVTVLKFIRSYLHTYARLSVSAFRDLQKRFSTRCKVLGTRTNWVSVSVRFRLVPRLRKKNYPREFVPTRPCRRSKRNHGINNLRRKSRHLTSSCRTELLSRLRLITFPRRTKSKDTTSVS